MGHPGRPRRRNKVQPVVQYPTKVVPQEIKPIKEETTANLHDESDLISFRNDALNRFITNQDLLENVTSKYIHTSKIVPPDSFPEPSDEIYFGDLKAMKQRSEALAKELEEPVEGINSELYSFEKEAIKRLTKELNSEEDLNALEEEYNSILGELGKFNKRFTTAANFRKFKVNLNINIDEAPAGYNPRQAPPPPAEERQKNGDFFANEFLEFQQPPQKDILDIGDDGMGLINFQGDEEMMNGNFDDDFLSQIDHSLE